MLIFFRKAGKGDMRPGCDRRIGGKNETLKHRFQGKYFVFLEHYIPLGI
jgi:hypothetical protein